jgi:hypothetical protein
MEPMSLELTRQFQFRLAEQLVLDNAHAHDLVMAMCRTFSISTMVPDSDTHSSTHRSGHYPLDRARISLFSSLARAAKLSFPALVRLYRGESSSDPRPNKAMCPARLRTLFDGYPFVDLLCQISLAGYIPPVLKSLPSQATAPPNHKSAQDNIPVLHHLVRGGQDGDQYLCLETLVTRDWSTFCSPVGLVPKKEQPLSVTARLIYDLSRPAGASINDYTDKAALPATPWHRVADIARRITFLLESRPPGVAIKGLVGDVRAAYRNLRIHADFAHLFGLSLPTVDVTAFDLSAAFGWSGSPALYCLFGNAIAEAVASECPHSLDPDQWHDKNRFWRFVWMDDHALIELDSPGRLVAAECALRLAMMATFGAGACAEDKFSGWTSIMRCVGLDFDLDRGLVSMPAPKIAKARSRVDSALLRAALSRHELQKLLGSLRHVCSCIPAGRAFYQHLQSTLRRTYRFGRKKLSTADLDDLRWFQFILDHGPLHAIPTSLFAHHGEPTVYLYMDASDYGLCVLDLGSRCFIRLAWDAVELEWIRRLNADNSTRSRPSHTPA